MNTVTENFKMLGSTTKLPYQTQQDMREYVCSGDLNGCKQVDVKKVSFSNHNEQRTYIKEENDTAFSPPGMHIPEKCTIIQH